MSTAIEEVKVRRWRCTDRIESSSGAYVPVMEEDEQGGFVSYEEHAKVKKELDELLATKEQVLAEAERLRSYIERAEDMYCLGSDDNIEIDPEPTTSEGEDGVWVSAWVLVPHPDSEDDEDDEDEDENEH